LDRTCPRIRPAVVSCIPVRILHSPAAYTIVKIGSQMLSCTSLASIIFSQVESIQFLQLPLCALFLCAANSKFSSGPGSAIDTMRVCASTR